MGNVCCPTNNSQAMKELKEEEDNNNGNDGTTNNKSKKSSPKTSFRQRSSSYNKMQDEISNTVNILPTNTNNKKSNNNNINDNNNTNAAVATTTPTIPTTPNNKETKDSSTTSNTNNVNNNNNTSIQSNPQRKQSISKLEHVGKYVILEELGHGSQAVVHKCAIKEEYKTYMNLKYPTSAKKNKDKPLSSNGSNDNNNKTTKVPTCNFYAMKIVKKKSILRRRKRHKAMLDSPKTHDKIKRKIGKYGYATGKIAKEIAVLKRLEHENIVNVIDVLDDPDQDKLYIVMEYLPSGALLPDWKEGESNEKLTPLSEETVRVIYRDIALAMLYMHTHNVVHRDIKPSNILMSTSNVGHGGAKLADFGVAHIFADDNENLEDLESFVHEPLVGTPLFRPPESFSPESMRASVRSLSVSSKDIDMELNDGHLTTDNDSDGEEDDDDLISNNNGKNGSTYNTTENKTDSSSSSSSHSSSNNQGSKTRQRIRVSSLLLKQQGLGDVWSFGVSLYLTVMGRPPFTGKTYDELEHNIKTKPILFNFENAPTISIGLQQFLKKTLERNISKRLTSEDIMNDPWISMDGILPTLKLSRQESEPFDIEEKEINEALTLVMRTMEFVSFSSTWLMHARREIKEHHKHDNDTNKTRDV